MKKSMKIDQKHSKKDWPPTRLGGKCRSRCAVLALAFAGGTVSLGLSAQAYADALYETGFEKPTFQNGDLLLGTDGWSTAIPPFLNPEAARISRDKARRGRQSVEVHGGDLVGSEGITAPYDAVGSYRRPIDYTVSGSQRFARVDADLLLETDQPKTRPGDEFFSLTISARSGDGETLGETGLTSEGVVEGFPFNATPGSLEGRLTQPIRFNKWYHLTMLLDFAHRTTSYFVDKHFLGAVTQAHQSDTCMFPGLVTSCALSDSDVLLRGALVVYARPDGEDGAGNLRSRSDYTAHFDNFRVSVHKAAPDIDR
jgi:hypothetical protein